ncbi:CsbD family protein [Paenibacillus xerothermodurans]|uniref:CsbD family protein n=1 Tax=Paenibacillus xerothermodurans TaxID=1977292 RepID=A0A2W1N8E8_PAEXE|nr:CsbD family protein [Paenibacillus xerothermodurans]PZE20164.1 CsbD family protein [Paenibacillus xerothermodurans]
MDNNVFKGKWMQMKGEVQKQWGKLTNDDLDVIDGEREKLIGKLQERYGYAKEDAEREYHQWSNMHRV